MTGFDRRSLKIWCQIEAHIEGSMLIFPSTSCTKCIHCQIESQLHERKAEGAMLVDVGFPKSSYYVASYDVHCVSLGWNPGLQC